LPTEPNPRTEPGQINGRLHPRILAEPAWGRVPAQTDEEILAAHAAGGHDEKPLAKVAVIIPAHNEEDTIHLTVQGAREQTYAAHRIVVMADNCTDRTVDIARAHGAEVHETVDNTGKKGGAINQALDLVLPTLEDHDFVMTMDADGTIAPDLVEIALGIFQARPGVGGLSGSVRTREQRNWIETAQSIEYERGRRIMARRGGRIHVLSGAAALFKVHVLREVAEARGTKLPGTQGRFMLEGSLVEDYELTLAVLELGYSITSSKRVQLITDLMPTLHELESQRIRWYRGTLETLHLYGWKPYNRYTYASIAFNMLASTLLPLAVLALVFGYLAFGSWPGLLFFGLVPLFIAENYLCAKRVGTRRAKVLALTFFPLWLYDNIQFAIYWRALWYALKRKESSWDDRRADYE
jgi:poly-beta-1,6-N-acetyl-D-glucosamine synthase